MINELESKTYLRQKQIAINQSKPDLSTMDKIANRILRQTGINSMQLKSKSRQRKLVDARIVFSILSKETNKTNEDIGYYLNRDHSTITHYINNNSEISEIKKLISLIS